MGGFFLCCHRQCWPTNFLAPSPSCGSGVVSRVKWGVFPQLSLTMLAHELFSSTPSSRGSGVASRVGFFLCCRRQCWPMNFQLHPPHGSGVSWGEIGFSGGRLNDLFGSGAPKSFGGGFGGGPTGYALTFWHI
jgi:hypothetical protein